MTTLRRRLLLPHARAWALWLALLLPLAQLAAGGHGLAHSLADGANPAKQAAHLAQCDLCLAGAAIGSGAAPAVIAAPSLPALRHAAPLPLAGSTWSAPAPRAYRSRAPPLAPH